MLSSTSQPSRYSDLIAGSGFSGSGRSKRKRTQQDTDLLVVSQKNHGWPRPRFRAEDYSTTPPTQSCRWQPLLMANFFGQHSLAPIWAMAAPDAACRCQRKEAPPIWAPEYPHSSAGSMLPLALISRLLTWAKWEVHIMHKNFMLTYFAYFLHILAYICNWDKLIGHIFCIFFCIFLHIHAYAYFGI